MAFGNQNGKFGGGFGNKNTSFGDFENTKNGNSSTGVFGNSNNTNNNGGGFGNSSNTNNNGGGFGTSRNTTGGFGSSTWKPTVTPPSNGGNVPGNGTGNSTTVNPNNTQTNPATLNNPIQTKQKSNLVYIRGKISQYKTFSEKDGNYRRLFPRKLYQSIAYNQRFEDYLHSFVVTEIQGTDAAGNPIQQSYVVNVHGSTNFGASLVDNEEVEVKGKFTHDNILMASSINVIKGSTAIPIKFQRSVKNIAITIFAVALILFGIIGFASMGNGNSLSGFFNNVWSFITSMFAIYVILLILYVISQFTRIGFMTRLLSGGRRGSPLIAMLVIAFILTLLLYNVFGLGTIFTSALSGILGAVGPIIVLIIAIILLIKIFK